MLPNYEGRRKHTCVRRVQPVSPRTRQPFHDEQGAGREAVGGVPPNPKDAEPEPDLYPIFGGFLVNAAFLLVTSALIVGQPAAEKKPAPPPAPAVAASSCGHDCDCDGFGHKLRHKFRGLFNRDSCDSCPTTACPTTTCHSACHTPRERTPLFRSSCADACKPKWTWEPRCHEHKAHCAPAPTCSDPCERVSFLSKLRERFKRGDCCDSGCASAVPAKAPEKIDTAPKKMPDTKDKGKKTEEVRIDTPAPFAPNTIRVTPTVPSVEIVPVPAPRVEGDRRDPF